MRADTSVYSISSHYALSKKEKSVGDIKKSMIVLMAITTILALLFPDIVGVAIFAGGISLILPLAMIYLLMNGKNPKRFIGSIVGGLIGLTIGIFALGLEPTIALPALIGGALGLFWKGKKI